MRKNSQSPSIETWKLSANDGLRVSVLNLGATLARIRVPTANGYQQVILAYRKDKKWAADAYYLGSTVGPFANRIGDARFSIDDEEFALEANEEATGHCLHSGSTGLHQQFFDVRMNTSGDSLECQCELSDGLGGFPGNRRVRVDYSLINPTALAIDFEVTSDKDTVVSLANHAYFNLGGSLSRHKIAIHADAYTPVDPSNIPTGEIRSVADTRFDLRSMRPVAEQMFDHNFVVMEGGSEPRLAAELRSPESGVHLRVLTTQPGLQLYTADYLESPFEPRGALCLEAQGFPDAPNQPGFPSARLIAGEVYRQRTVYDFSATTC